MAQHNVRFNTYDPAVEKVLQQLKSCNKQAVFVGDAIKYYLGTKQGRQAAELMCRRKIASRSASAKSCTKPVNKVDTGELLHPVQPLECKVDCQPKLFTADTIGTSLQSASLLSGTSRSRFIDRLFDLREKR
ncbi:MAG: hypothetical protein ACYDG4_08655 [Desulfuromonadaceae bacterium]